MSILQLEKHMLYLKGWTGCQITPGRLARHSLKQVRYWAWIQPSNRATSQWPTITAPLHKTLVTHLDCKEQDLNVLTHEVMKKKAQNQEWNNTVATCQTKKPTLESEINNQITILAKETKDMEHRHCEQLNEKENKIKYFQQSNYAHIQCFLKMQDSSATFYYICGK